MFWDSSAIVPVLVPETRSSEMADLLRSSGTPVVWWGTLVECQSAIHRKHRESPMPRALFDSALERLELLFEHCDTVPPGEGVRRRAGRLLATHALRAADALQLAAALAFTEEEPQREVFVCLDGGLREAASKEGFQLLPVTIPSEAPPR